MQTMLGFNGGGSLDAILQRERPSWWRLFFAAPVKTLAKTLYPLRNAQLPQLAAEAITVVCVSDTHNSQPKVPDGDLLIHAGDLTQSGSLQELQTTIAWLDSLPHLHKVVVAGNHDMHLEITKSDVSEQRVLNWGRIVYLLDSSTSLRFPGGRILNLYGSPWTRKHGNWAFQYPRYKDMWTSTVPSDVDILVTHGPPRFHLDVDGFGDEFLLKELWRTRPALHVFGHVHEGYGTDMLVFDEFEVSYERIMRGEGGLLDLLRMVVRLASSRLWPGTPRETRLVNASAVGGLQDTVKREPTIVRI